MFTAHPTEAVRRALLEKEQLMVASLVSDLDGQRTDAVLAVDHLALLGHTQASVHAASRRSFDRARGLATATADGAATTMEESQFDTEFVCCRQQFHLPALQAPARSGDATVLAAVGIAQHHHLHVVARFEMRAVDRVGQQITQRVRAMLKICLLYTSRCV